MVKWLSKGPSCPKLLSLNTQDTEPQGNAAHSLKAWTAGLLAILVNENGEYIFHVLTDELKQRSLASYSR